MFHLITGLIALYVFWRMICIQRWSRPVKGVAGVLILLVAEHHLITRTFFGSMASPEIPGEILMLLGWAFGALIVSALVLLVLDFTALVFARAGSVGSAVKAPGLRAGVGLAAMLLTALGVWQAVRVPDVRDVEIELARLPAELDGLQLVQLTDLHASRLLQRPWMEAVVAKANALQPDLMVITGDLVDGTVAAREQDVEPLRDLRARLGVYAIPGNHEYYAEYQNWLGHFESLGLPMLLNEHVTIEDAGASLVLAGITDPAASRFGQPLPDIEAALAGVPPEAAVILLSHRPLAAAGNALAGADLQLSGHTHGGQVLGMHWVTQAFNEGYVSGEYAVGDMRLYVSNGAGLWNGFPLRLGKPSEITRITLRAAKG
ncbi:metallophosphoesterase [Pseudomonas sp. MM211]|uniref:metallophosphoesterase n=1 Tax=Pseudomonas sp. MM211 TaxID=2866808 RepID=UPI001CEDB030|nr:metallophosphoesterase [Pseudomonas sp. MM211]UCJ16672.1 metallophosphoesterase [Pseudomonas sp. MM211]